MKKILLTGGGTAGHIMPLIAVYEELKNKGDFQFLVIGSGLKNLPINYKNILTGKWRRGFALTDIIKNFIDLLKIPIGIIQSFWHILIFMPDVCFGKGGYASVPAIIICKIFFIPIVIHESDTVPGVSNVFLSKFAKKVCISFDYAKKFFKQDKIVFTGNPIRRSILSQNQKLIEFNNNKPVVLVIGGSQGAQRINELIYAILPKLLQKANVIHQTGAGKQINFKSQGYKQFDFIQDIGKAYYQANLIVSRAGANSLAEIAALSKPCILIPLPTASNNHQVKNAYAFTKVSGAIVLEQKTLGPHLLLNKIIRLLDSPLKAKKMGENAHDVNPIDASARISNVILSVMA